MADVLTIGTELDPSGFRAGSKVVRSESKQTANSVQRDSKRMGSSFDRLVKSMKRGAKSAVSALNPFRNIWTTLASGAGIGAAIAGASQFEAKMLEVSTLLEDTSGMDALTAAAARLSTEFGNTSTEQAAGLYQAISAGASTSAEAVDVLTAANKLALGGVTDTETAVDGLTSVLNAYGDKAGSAADVSDAFFVAMKAGKTTVDELARSVGLAAPLAEATGVSFEELLGSVAALTKGGIRTAIAMRGIRQVLAVVAKPTSEAADEAKRLGLEFNVAAVQSKGLLGFLEDVVAKSGGSTDSLAQLFGSVEALVPILRLAGAGGQDFADIMVSMGMKSGETEKAVAKMQEAFKFKWRVFVSTFRDLAEAIGTALLPAMTGFIEALTAGIKWVRGIGDELALLAKIVAIGGGLSLGLKALPLVMGSIGAAASGVIPAIKGFGAAMVAMATAVTGANHMTAASFFTLQTSMKVFSAFLIGWQIGKYFREKYLAVELAGIALAKGMTKMVERVKTLMTALANLAPGGASFTDAFTGYSERLQHIESEYEALADAAIKARTATETVIPPPPDGGADVPAPDSPAAPVVNQDAIDFQKKVNDLLASYAKQAALGSKATEMQRISYELLNGELKKANESQREQLLLAAQQADTNALNEQADQILKEYAKTSALNASATEKQRIEYALLNTELKNLSEARKQELMDAAAAADKNKLVAEATSRIKQLEQQTASLTIKTKEEAIAYELASGSLAGLKDGYGDVATKLTEAARNFDDAKFAEEAKALEESLDPAKRYAAALEHLNVLRERGGLSAEAYSDAVYNEFMRTSDVARTARDSMGNFFNDVITGTESMSDAFKKMGQSILDSMNKVISEQLADQLMKSLFTSGASAAGGGGGGGFLAGLGGLLGFANGGSAPVSALAVPGYANGGDFRVGGSGGLDSQLVAFRASPNETVSVKRPSDASGGINVTNHFAISAPNGQVDRESQNQIAARVGRSIDTAMRRNT